MSTIRHLGVGAMAVLALGALAVAACSSGRPPPANDSVGGLEAVPSSSCLVGRYCNGVCIDTTSSRYHCGACGKTCTPSQVCVLGNCVSGDGGCAPPLALCGEQCLDTSADPANCGDCGKVCPRGLGCTRGVCEVRCPAGTVRCGSSCVEPNADREHCGATEGCGETGGTAGAGCAAATSCFGGQCLGDCEEGKALCPSGCVDVVTNDQHCGGCNNRCSNGKQCSNRVCCPPGFTGCMGTCRDTSKDPEACGACGVACPTGTTCVAGGCQ